MEKDEFEKKKYFSDKLWDLIIERHKTIIFIIQLIIALLVIASFGDKLVPDSSFIIVRSLLIFLLLLTPIMLIDYLSKINEGLYSLSKVLEDDNDKHKRWYSKIIDGSNWLYAFIVIIIIDIIAGIIINHTMLTLLLCLIQLIFIGIIVFYQRTKK